MKIKWPIIFFFSGDYGLRSPVIQETFQAKTAASIVARVLFCKANALCTCRLGHGFIHRVSLSVYLLKSVFWGQVLELTLLGVQSQFGEKSPENRLRYRFLCTAVLRGLIEEPLQRKQE